MKRILKAGIFGAAVSIFFTGCGSSALISGDRGYQEVAQDAMSADETLSEWKKDSDVLAKETTQAPDYYEENEKDKFTNLSGPQAFRIKDGHSEDTDDIESFEVEALRGDGTFLYCYATRIGVKDKNAKTDNRQKVHCAAMYNYDTKTFNAFYENAFSSAEDESFYMQVSSDGTGDIFVYDNGIGNLYSSDGTLKLQIQIGSFVRKNFKGYAVGATKALAYGNRVYVNVFIETESVADLPEDAEEGELDQKTLEVVLVYELEQYSNTIDQVNLTFDDQGEEWEDMWDDQELGSAPDQENDWKTAVGRIPSKWGQAFLYKLSTEDNPMYIYQWKNGTSFVYNDKDAKKRYIPDFQPVKNSYSAFTNLRNGMVEKDFAGLFIIKDGHYYELTGKTGTDLGDGDYAGYDFERTITLTKSGTDENGNTTTEKEEIEQTIWKYKKRDVRLQNGYLEGYWILENADTVLNVIDGTLFWMNGDKVYWSDTDNKEESLSIGEDAVAEVVKENGTTYIIVSANNQTSFYQLSSDRKTTTYKGAIQNDKIRDVVKKAEAQQTTVDSIYHENHAEQSGNKDANAGMLLNGKNTLHVTLNSVQESTLQSIVSNNKITVPGVRENLTISSKYGYLVTSLTSGLLYLNRTTQQAICLDAGTWYSVWRKGSSFVAVGFDNDQANYNTMDMVNARVKEFDLDELYKNSLDALLASVKEEEPEESTEADEGLEQMQKDYDKKREDETVEFVKPDDNQEILDAWKDKKPGEVTAEKQKEKENAQSESKSESESASDAS